MPNVVVTNNNDTGPGSLRQAIADVASGGTITFSSLFSGPEVAQTITLTNGQLVISKNMAITGPGANLLTISGGGAGRIFFISVEGITVSLSGMTITGGNVQIGGGISNAGNLTVSECHVTGNTASLGGGLYSDGTLTLLRSTVSNNTATSPSTGGGIDGEGTLTVTDSTFSGNSAPNGNNNGGAIWATNTTTITNSTITNNTAAGASSAGGIYRFNQTVTIRNSIIAGNGSATPDIFAVGNTGIASNGYNLIGNRGTIVFSGTADQAGDAGTPLNPMLGPLQNNGGSTPTHALVAGSPAFDAGNSSGSFNDQRGPAFLRVVDLLVGNASGGDGADIGAYEAQSEPGPVFAAVSGKILTPSGLALRNTVVTLIDSQSVRRIATTGSAGIYTFENVATGQTYVMTVSSKRYRFAARTVDINGNLTNLDFVGLE
jgi:predicted outer membrane repeat protein